MSSGSKTYPSGADSRGYRLDSVSRQKRPKGGAHSHPLSIPNDTIWESDSKEQIVANTDRPAGSPSNSNSGDEAPLGMPMHRPGATAVRGSGTGPSNPHHIVVTTSYTVAEGSPDTNPIGVPRF